MTGSTADEKLREAFAAVFAIHPGSVDDALSQDQVAAWDSIAHVSLILSLESAFGVQFEPEETEALTSVKIIRLTLRERGIDI